MNYFNWCTMKYLTRQNDLPNVYASLRKCAQMCMIELANDRVKKWKRQKWRSSERDYKWTNEQTNERAERRERESGNGPPDWWLKFKFVPKWKTASIRNVLISARPFQSSPWDGSAVHLFVSFFDKIYKLCALRYSHSGKIDRFLTGSSKNYSMLFFLDFVCVHSIIESLLLLLLPLGTIWLGVTDATKEKWQ